MNLRFCVMIKKYLILFPILLSLFSYCQGLFGLEVELDERFRLEREYEEGQWAEYLEELACKYQDLVASRDPLRQLYSLSCEERKKTVQTFREMRKDQRTMFMKLSKRLKTVLEKHGVDPFRGFEDQTESVQRIALSVFQMEFVFLLVSPIDFLYDEIEWGLKEDILKFLTSPRWFEPFGSERIDAIIEFADALHPIMVEYTAKASIAYQNGDGREALYVIGLDKHSHLRICLNDMIGEAPANEEEAIAFYDSERYEASNFMHDVIDSSYAYDEIFLNSLSNYIEFFQKLLQRNDPYNETEEDILAVLREFKDFIFKEWKSAYYNERFSYVL